MVQDDDEKSVMHVKKSNDDVKNFRFCHFKKNVKRDKLNASKDSETATVTKKCGVVCMENGFRKDERKSVRS